VARLVVNDGGASFNNAELNRQDFVLQANARVVEGDSSTYLIGIFHIVASDYHFDIELNSVTDNWVVRKIWGGHQQTDTHIVGQDNVSPLGKWTLITIVARGPRAAVYLNGMPVAYFEDADFDKLGGTSLQCISIRQAVCEFDNIKFWNLANVPGLP
jgi:hypothetical protein